MTDVRNDRWTCNAVSSHRAAEGSMDRLGPRWTSFPGTRASTPCRNAFVARAMIREQGASLHRSLPPARSSTPASPSTAARSASNSRPRARRSARDADRPRPPRAGLPAPRSRPLRAARALRRTILFHRQHHHARSLSADRRSAPRAGAPARSAPRRQCSCGGCGHRAAGGWPRTLPC